MCQSCDPQRLELACSRARIVFGTRVVHHHARGASLGEPEANRAADAGAAAGDNWASTVEGHARLVWRKMPISLDDANKLVASAHARAAEIGVNVSAAVVDEGGHLIALGRMDGAPPLSPQIAEAKAVGAAMLLRDGASLLQMAEDRPGFFSAVDRLVRMPLIPGPGSLPIT